MRLITVINELLFHLITGLSRERLSSPNSWRQPVNRRSILVWDMIEMVILLVRDPLSSLTEPNNVIRLLCSRVDRLSLSRAVTHCSRLGTL